MCEHISYRNHNGEVLYIILGHGAIAAVWGLPKNELEERELQSFWQGDKLPLKLRNAAKDFATWKKNFGTVFTTGAQPDDLDFVMTETPKNDPSWIGLRDFAHALLVERREQEIALLVKRATTEVVPVTLDDEPVSALVSAGKYDGYVNQSITDENFPKRMRPTEAQNLVIVDFHTDYVESWDAHLAMEAMGLIPGTSRETLTIGRDRPDLQRKHWLVGLGDSWRGSGGFRYVVVLFGHAEQRNVALYDRRRRWRRDYRFVALDK